MIRLRRIAAITAAIVMFACRAGFADMSFDPEQAIKNAETMAKSGNLDGALDALLFSMLGADSTTAWKVRMERSKIFAMKGDALASLGQMDLAVKGAPEKECARVQRAELYYALGESGLAETDLATATEQGCGGEEVQALKARLLVNGGDLFNAANAYGELMDSEEYGGEALGNMGLIYSLIGYPETAVEYYKLAIEKLPESGGLLAELADAQTLAGDFDGALANYKKAYSLDPKNKVAANNYAYTLILTGKTDDAVKIFDVLNKDNPNPYSLCNMMEVNVAKEDWETAFTYGNMCLKAFSADPELMESEKYYIGAIGMALRTIQQDTLAVHPLTQIDLANQHLADGERAEALASFLFALMMDPKNAGATFEAGRLMMQLGQYSRGASYLNMAAALSGGDREMKEKVRKIIDAEAMARIDSGWQYGSAVAGK